MGKAFATSPRGQWTVQELELELEPGIDVKKRSRRRGQILHLLHLDLPLTETVGGWKKTGFSNGL
jgi:hypothetical protein